MYWDSWLAKGTSDESLEVFSIEFRIAALAAAYADRTPASAPGNCATPLMDENKMHVCPVRTAATQSAVVSQLARHAWIEG